MFRDRLALAIIGAAAAVLVVTAYGFWRNGGTGQWLPAMALPIHGLATLAWIARPEIRRRFVVAFGLIEATLGAAYFATAPILHGRFAPPGEPLVTTAHVWALVGLAVAGALLVIAGLVHSPVRRASS